MQQSLPSRSRPGLVTAAAIVLIIFGGLGTVFGLIGILGAGFVASVGGGIGMLLLILTLVSFVLAILSLAAGIGLLAGAGWSRGLAVMVSWAAILVSVASFVLNLMFFSTLEASSGVPGIAGGAAAGGIIGVVLAVAIYGFVIWALSREKAYFTA